MRATAGNAINGINTSTGGGIYGGSVAFYGVMGGSTNNYGIYGQTSSAIHGGVLGYAQNATTYGILGHANQYSLYGNGDAFLSGTYLGSDLRLKKDVHSLNNALETVMKLRPVSYKWKEDSDQAVSQKGVKHGFIAQEVQKILPDVVRENIPPVLPGAKKLSLNQKLKSFLTVEYNEFIAYLAKAIQELNNKLMDYQMKNDQRVVQVEKESARLNQENTLLKQENKAIKTYLCSKDPRAAFCK